MPTVEEHRRKVVVDGSNIATEGRSTPSLAQLEEAIAAFFEEYPGFEHGDLIVVVDATFGHRIDPAEHPRFDEAVAHGEMVAPPAGAVGRGDAFILRIAEKAGALVLSNDSFQEFHVERPWLFDPGRLIGGKPIPGVGWIFTPRTPVRGPVSRATASKAKRAAAKADGRADVPGTPATGSRARTKASATGDGGATAGSTATATRSRSRKAAAPDVDGVAPDGADAVDGTDGSAGPAPKKRSRSRKKAAPADPAAAPAAVAAPADDGPAVPTTGPGSALNEPLVFLQFVADHPVGSTFEGVVAAFTSHGAHVDVGGMRCHVPLRGLSDPAPQKARDVLARGGTYEFRLVSLDAPRRRAELALAAPGT